MPTYEYKCSKCNHYFEDFHSMNAEPLKKCPKCGKNSLKKLISGGAGLIFKGTGFYLTDYKNKKSTGKTETNNIIEKVKTDSIKKETKIQDKKSQK